MPGTNPRKELLRLSEKSGVRLVMPKLGEAIEPAHTDRVSHVVAECRYAGGVAARSRAIHRIPVPRRRKNQAFVARLRVTGICFYRLAQNLSGSTV